MNINRTELINRVAWEHAHRKYMVKNITEDLFATIAQALANGDKVTIRGFGTFEVKDFKGHPIVHPGTGERQFVADYKNVVFHPGDELTRMVRCEE